MAFCIEDTRKKAAPAVQGLIDNTNITLENVTDWLRFTRYVISRKKFTTFWVRILLREHHTSMRARKP
jgi:hypothetical protein